MKNNKLKSELNILKRLFSEIKRLSIRLGLTKSALWVSSKTLTRNKGKLDNIIPIDNINIICKLFF